MESNLKTVLFKIATQLNEAKVTWAVGASIVLDYYDLLDKPPRDIDLIVQVDDVEKVDHILETLGKKQSWEKSEQYSTPYFYEFIIDDIDIDVMAELTINTSQGQFRYHFDKKYIHSVWSEMGTEVPLTSLEDWFVLYGLMENREEKVKRIGDYFKHHKPQQMSIEAELRRQNVMPEQLMRQIAEIKEDEKGCFREAKPDEFLELNELAAQSEAHWGYDEAFLNEFKTFYAMDAEYISENPTYVYLREEQIVAFYSLVLKGRFCELEFFYVRPDLIGQGIGRVLWNHMLKRCSLLKIEVITFVTNPEAKAFYEKMGAIYSGEIASFLKTDRMIPKFYYKLDWTKQSTY
ncbi:GNAT family N-acetyltransferase [Fusibacter ferrireducens]|uniref:GNAT family N-acetyltransferase n=1 Tax=Fusibacter ferrireducens TaxID=2785058 RepID=A0ABR9ZPK1_9FIRM|nr:GNAT family N-acetyltransferase [Fusibacter ferrireducens]MBF4692369.1 GNAT family N-acetyltransferase [Fusibacter ferrireducens]